MTIKSTGNLTKGFVMLSLVLLAIVAQTIVAVKLSQGEWGAIRTGNWFQVFIPSLIFCLIIVVLGAGQYFERERFLRMAVNGVMPIATNQPNPSEALSPGETLRLSRELIVDPTFLFWYAPFAVLVFAGLTGGLVSLQNPVYNENQSSIAIAFLSLPFVAGGVLGGWLMWGAASNRLSIVIANDRGITQKQPLHRTRFIPWDDITLFYFERGAPTSTPYRIAMLVGTRHILRLELGALTLKPATTSPYHFLSGTSMHAESHDDLVADAQAYQAAMTRLWATIVVRASTALRQPERAASSSSLNQSMMELVAGDMKMLHIGKRDKTGTQTKEGALKSDTSQKTIILWPSRCILIRKKP